MTATRFAVLLALGAVGLMGMPVWAQQGGAPESARSIPVAYDVDVVVVGGSTGAVAAAVAAAEAGADVFLAAPRPYLGEDVCGTYRLWLEPDEEPPTPLAQRMFEEPPAVAEVGEGLLFSYAADRSSNERHKDSDPPSKLADGRWKNAYSDSVEYSGGVTLTLDLGSEQSLGRIHVLAFQRSNDIELACVDVSISSDGQNWQHATTIENDLLGQENFIDSALCLSAPLEGTARYLRLEAKKTDNPLVERVLLGEVVVQSKEQATQAEGAGEHRVPPAPMQVKRTLDQALLDAGVDFLYGCYATDVLRDDEGRLAGIVMANRSGRQAVKARMIIDATERAAVARIAGASFTPYPAGAQEFTRVVIGGEPREGQGIRCREMPSPVKIALAGKAYVPAFGYTLTVPMKDGSFASFVEAEQLARDMTWDPGQLGASDFLFQVPPDSMKAETQATGAWSGAEHVDLAAFRPAGIDGLYVLGGCAGVSRKAAAELLRPLEFMAVGTRVGEAAAGEAGAQPKPAIVCFGDSITAGLYPKKLGRMLPGYRVVNAGGGGNTSAQGLARMENDVYFVHPAAIVIMFGTNDSCLTGVGQYKNPIENYTDNLREMATRSRARGTKVLLCTAPPIVEEPYYGRHPQEFYEPDGGLQAILDRYGDAVIKLGKSIGIPVLDLHEELARDMSSVSVDGVHPTAKGERMIAELVAGHLKQMLPVTEGPRESRPVAVAARADSPPVADHLKGADVGEFLSGIRPMEEVVGTVSSPNHVLPILGEYDVVVLGGGTGGAPAGISAARNGAKTLVVEYLTGLGGVGTLGLIGKYYYGYRGGFTAEIDEGVAAMGPEEDAPKPGGWNVEWKMAWLRRALRDAGADVWFGTLGCGALVDDGTVKGIVVATPEGRGVVVAKTVIDSTGNSDVAAAAGAECIYTDGSHVAVQGTGLPPRKPGAEYTNTDYTLADDSNVVDTWRMFVVARGKYEKAFDLGQLIDTRERRRIVGDFVISPLDIYYRRTYADTIGLSQSNFDTHGFTVHPFFSLKVPDKDAVTGYTPYRALLPKGLDGILVTGLGISAHRDAMPILRMQPDIQNQGYAAGLAAATAAKQDTDLRSIDLKPLQAHLVEKGCVPEAVLTDSDSFPMSPETVAQAVKSVVNDYDGVGVALAHADLALPLLRAAYGTAEFEKDKLTYAHILGMMGDATGAETLVEQVTASDWDEGWSFRGGGQFGTSMSRLDSFIVALGQTGDERALDPIVAKAEQLTAESEFSHHRAVALASEALGDPRAAEVLAQVLKKPGMMGHAYVDIEDAERGALPSDPNQERDHSLRELILARALYRCGDHEGLGKRILNEYARDFRGHHARHATAVLNEAGKESR